MDYDRSYTVLHRQTAVTAYFLSKQLLLFACMVSAVQNCMCVIYLCFHMICISWYMESGQWLMVKLFSIHTLKPGSTKCEADADVVFVHRRRRRDNIRRALINVSCLLGYADFAFMVLLQFGDLSESRMCKLAICTLSQIMFSRLSCWKCYASCLHCRVWLNGVLYENVCNSY